MAIGAIVRDLIKKLKRVAEHRGYKTEVKPPSKGLVFDDDGLVHNIFCGTIPPAL